MQSEVTGAANLMASKNLEHSYTKLASKKMKDSLSSFLPGLPGVIDTPGSQVCLTVGTHFSPYFIHAPLLLISCFCSAPVMLLSFSYPSHILQISYFSHFTHGPFLLLSCFSPAPLQLTSTQDNSSLRSLIEKPPVCGKELLLLNQVKRPAGVAEAGKSGKAGT